MFFHQRMTHTVGSRHAVLALMIERLPSGRGITASFYGFFPLYFPELFPTSVRATGQGFCFNFGRLIAAIGSLQLGNLMSMFGSAKKSSNRGCNHALQANAYSVLSCVYVDRHGAGLVRARNQRALAAIDTSINSIKRP
jgi:hypothetical protein